VVAKAGAIVNDVRMARITMEREMRPRRPRAMGVWVPGVAGMTCDRA